MDEEGRIRSRMAKLAREMRYVKQRFAVGDADRRPYLVRSLKVELRDRDKPARDRPLSTVMATVQATVGDDPTAHRVLHGLEQMLQTHWDHEDPPLAGFQARALTSIFPAWLGRDAETSFVITADTGAGKTEAACLPLIAGAACDRLRGVQGTRAALVYPRVRLAANQAQRITGYLAALAGIEDMPALTLGLQNWQVPTTLAKIHESLHQWQQNPGYGALFGDLAPYRPPRAILADVIHLYTHVHGAQVGYALRRALARWALNAPHDPSPLAIGMSATLGGIPPGCGPS